MEISFHRRHLYILGAFLALWLGAKYLFPVVAPFAAGTVIALLAEPLVRLLTKKLPRGLGAGIGVTVTLAFLAGLLSIVGAAAVRQVGILSQKIPDLGRAAGEGIVHLQDFLVNLTQKAPEGMRATLTGSVLRLFDSGSAVVDEMTRRIPNALTKVIGWVPKGAMSIGTALISSFLISARLPKLKTLLREKLPQSWTQSYLPNIKKAGKAVSGWLKAQLRLSAVTYLIVAVGFLLLRIPNALLWGLLIAVVDAVPILGTGTVLVPWGIVCLVQGNVIQGVGLFALCGAAIFTRSILEPRLVGRQLGLDPLVTLIALYIGFRFWGILGLILAPILVTVAKNIVFPQEEM